MTVFCFLYAAGWLVDRMMIEDAEVEDAELL